MKWWRPVVIVGLIGAAIAGIAFWVTHAPLTGHWLQVHTGTVNEPGPYYGFWSGFGSDLTEFAVIGTIATGVYQLVKKYNCHYPGCWRVGNHPAAGGQFSLCYLHHPDYQGKKPTKEFIERLHREHLERQEAILGRFHELREHLTDKPAGDNGVHGPGAPGAQTDGSGKAQADPGKLGVTDDPARHVKSR